MILFVLIHCSVMSGRLPVFLDRTSTKQWIKCIAEGDSDIAESLPTEPLRSLFSDGPQPEDISL